MRCRNCNKIVRQAGAKFCLFCGQAMCAAGPVAEGENKDIRHHAARRGVKLWQIADALGIADSSFSRKLRKELPDEEKNRIIAIIDELARDDENA